MKMITHEKALRTLKEDRDLTAKQRRAIEKASSQDRAEQLRKAFKRQARQDRLFALKLAAGEWENLSEQRSMRRN